MKVGDDVLTVLDRTRCDGGRLYLPEQLDRQLYVRVAKVIEAAGGKWSRKESAHVFPSGEAADAIDQVLLTGAVARAQDTGWFPTPPAVVDRLMALVSPSPGMWALEPSAGRGAIAGPLLARGCNVVAVEQDPAMAQELAVLPGCITAAVGDFLEVIPNATFDVVVMNPPFGRQADVVHVTHALGFLAPGAQLVAVMSAGVTFRGDRRTAALRELVDERGGEIRPLPPGSFRESGTMVNTVILKVDAA